VSASSKLACLVMLCATTACASGQPSSRFEEVRALQEPERTAAFHRLDDAEKLELFFAAAQRHPPYRGLTDAFAAEGGTYLVRVREAIDARGGAPEVLAFLGVAEVAARNGTIARDHVAGLRLATVCERATSSSFCPELRDRVVAGLPQP
jgi:hypothetical protein